MSCEYDGSVFRCRMDPCASCGKLGASGGSPYCVPCEDKVSARRRNEIIAGVAVKKPTLWSRFMKMFG